MGYFVLYASLLTGVMSICSFIYLCFMTPTKEQQFFHLMLTCVAVHTVSFAITVIPYDPAVSKAYLHVSFIGGASISFCFLLLLAFVTGKRLPRRVTIPFMSANCFLGVMGFTNPMHHQMYKSIDYIIIPGQASKRVNIEYGPMMYLYVAWQLVIISYGVILIVRCKNETPHVYKGVKSSIDSFLIASSLALLSFIICTVTKYEYDFTAIGCCLGSYAMLFSVFKFRTIPLDSSSKNAILDALDDIIIFTDPSGHYIFANNRAKNLFNLQSRFVYGMKMLGQDEELDKLLDLKTDESFTKNDDFFICQLLPIKDNKKTVGTVHWLKNITQERTFIAETIRLKEEAEAANVAKGQFLAQMSHEIRTPINGVLGMNELIRRESKDPIVADYSDNIKRSGETLMAIINDILDYSRAEAGKIEITPATYNLPVMIKDLLITARGKLEKKPVELDVHVDPFLPKLLFGDVVRVKQVISNVLTNAVKYTSEGTITLSVTYEPGSEGLIELKIAVSDTGSGIKSEDIPRLFDSFEKLDASRNIITEGAGLGMSITKRLLDLMDGAIFVESTYGQGSSFYISIPQKVMDMENVGVFDEAALKEKNTVAPHEDFTAPEAKILVVDDNSINRRLAIELMKHSQIQFDEAESGPEFLDMIKEKHYDLILLDHRMPEMSGAEALKIMRENKNHMCENVPVIAMTADAGNGAYDFFKDAGFDDYLPKPMNPKVYEAMLIKHLPHKLVKRY